MRLAFDGTNYSKSLGVFKNEHEGHRGLGEILTMDLAWVMREPEKGWTRKHLRTWLDYKGLRCQLRTQLPPWEPSKQHTNQSQV